MATLAEQRRAIGETMVARRGTGAQAQAARRAIGTAMEVRRTGKAAVEDINSLVTTPRQSKQLEAVEPRGTVAAKQGRGDYTEPTAGGAAGIASPLTEADYSSRQYWPDQTITSTDGLLSFRIKPIKQLTQADANGAEVLQVFAEPTAE